ncbi:hypothetical protein BDQ17DRAFT_1371574 [Cyathus striatus]|nr:hypothetical protein BDQ17DRAFT_1371574 [Cyathus striatus]
MDNLFQWKFATDTFSLSIATCVSLPIEVQPFNATNTTGSYGVPPYYMHAFAIDGTPTTTLVGTDNKTLNWTPNHPPGTQLLLTLVDSAGTSGGVSPSLYTVIAGQSTQCVTTDDTNDFTTSANNTDELTTCQPWSLKIKGGVPPYHIILAALDSPYVTNVTIPFGEDLFVYINRADPGTQLAAGISDSTGRWAKGTPLVKTKGSADVSCTGLNSFSANSTALAAQQQGSNSRSNNKIAFIAVPIVVLIIAGVVYFHWNRRRRERQYQLVEELRPRRFEDDKYDEPILSPGIRQVPNDSDNVNDEVVVLHRDGGSIRTLPPPYAEP